MAPNANVVDAKSPLRDCIINAAPDAEILRDCDTKVVSDDIIHTGSQIGDNPDVKSSLNEYEVKKQNDTYSDVFAGNIKHKQVFSCAQYDDVDARIYEGKN